MSPSLEHPCGSLQPRLPAAAEKLVVEITPDKYMDKLVDYCMVKIYAMANVVETRQAWSEEDDFVISKPKLRVQVG